MSIVSINEKPFVKTDFFSYKEKTESDGVQVVPYKDSTVNINRAVSPLKYREKITVRTQGKEESVFLECSLDEVIALVRNRVLHDGVTRTVDDGQGEYKQIRRGKL